jgi:hypothetical protein
MAQEPAGWTVKVTTKAIGEVGKPLIEAYYVGIADRAAAEQAVSET